MLSIDQIKTLAKIGGLELLYCDDIPISVLPIVDRNIKYPYDLFKKEMGLEDLRLDWLLGRKNLIAGGSVLAWILEEENKGDIDFFFESQPDTEAFSEFIKSIGFKETTISNYATTYFESEQGLILQIIGKDQAAHNIVAYGNAVKIINGFDFHICKFAVSNDYLYTTTRAIQDLLKMELDVTGFERMFVTERLKKYIKKGFYPSDKIMGSLSYTKQVRDRSVFNDFWR